MESSQPKLSRQKSSNVSNQQNYKTCWAFAVTRVILKFIKSVLPELQSLPTDSDECDKYYDINKFNKKVRRNFLFYLFGRGSINVKKCGEKEYKNLCLFMFIYFQLTNEFGCDGHDVYIPMKWFTNNFLNKQMDESKRNIFTEPYNSVALQIMTTFYSTEKGMIYTNYLKYNTNNVPKGEMKIYSSELSHKFMQRYTPNYGTHLIHPFFNIIKKVLHDNLYLQISFDLYGDDGDLQNFGVKPYDYCEKVLPLVPIINKKTGITTYEWGELTTNDIGVHSMVIIDYIDETNMKNPINNKGASFVYDPSKENDPTKQFLVIKNSWGKNWGDKGTITISIDELVRHCYLDVLYLSFESIMPIIQEIENSQNVYNIIDESVQRIVHNRHNMLGGNKSKKKSKSKNKSKKNKRKI